MAMTIHCDIVSAEEEIYSGLVDMLVATGELGELGVSYGHAPLPTPPPAPRKWVHVDSKTDGGADAGSSRARLMETKDRLKALVASGKGSDRDKAMLRILCNSLGDESCSSKQDSHSEAMPGVKPDSKQK